MVVRTTLSLFLILLIALFAVDCSKKFTDRELVDLAQKENSRGNPEKAVEYYERLLREFPDSEHAQMSLFMIGYIQSNEIRDFNRAKIVYQEFLEKYPSSELAASVKFELDNMGKNPEELIKWIF